MGLDFLLLLATPLAAGGDDRGIEIPDAQVTIAAQVRVPAREAGVLERLSIKEGDSIKAGKMVGQLDSKLVRIDRRRTQVEYDIAALRSENDVDRRYAVKSLEVAKSELQRSLESNELYPKSISKTELNQLRLATERSSLTIEQADRDQRVAELTKVLKGHAAEAAEEHFDRRAIVAPLSGMVVQIFRQPGEWLNPGDPVFRVVQLEKLRVEAFVDGTKYGAELLGCPVKLSVLLPPGNAKADYSGRVVFANPELHPVTGQMRVWAVVENKDLRLRPGTRGTLVIEPGRE